MDPNATLRDLEAELAAKDYRAAQRCRADLMSWLSSGGFAPDWSRYPTAARYCGYPQK
jgi:hypothetical protein